jgi:phage FluMu gp28-like protein
MPTIRTAFDKARAVLPELRFRQEWLAEFLSGSGLVFRNVDDCATAPRVERAEPGRRYAMGVDLARLTDLTVISVLDCTDDVPREVYLDRFQGVDWRLQIDRIAAVVGAFRPGMIAVDQTGVGDMPVGELQVALPDTVVWGVRFNVANKTAMVHGLAAAFERFGIEIQPDPVRMSELRAYSGKERLSGTLEYGAPSGMHDDTVSALMLAYDVAQHVNAPGMITI